MCKASILKVDGTVLDCEDKPTYNQVRELIGGYLEYIRMGGNKTMVVNEEGQFLNLPVNVEATKLLQQGSGNRVVVVVGTVIVLEGWRTVDA